MTPPAPVVEVGERLVAVADSTPVFLLGLVRAVAELDWPVAAAGTPAEVRDLLGRDPAVLVVDVRLLTAEPGLASAARDRDIPMVVTIGRDGLDDAVAVAESGVAGMWDRDGDPAELRNVLVGACDGDTRVSSAVGGAILERLAAGASAPQPGGALTPREREILELMSAGAGNRGIAEQLVISENTVRNHVRSVLEKLQAQSRTEAVVRAMREGLVRLR